jgi:hypothetical protein
MIYELRFGEWKIFSYRLWNFEFKFSRGIKCDWNISADEELNLPMMCSEVVSIISGGHL